MKSNKPESDKQVLLESYQVLTKHLVGALGWMLNAHDPKNPEGNEDDRQAACETARTLLERIKKG